MKTYANVVEVSCINVHPWFATFSQVQVFDGDWFVSFVCSGGVQHIDPHAFFIGHNTTTDETPTPSRRCPVETMQLLKKKGSAAGVQHDC